MATRVHEFSASVKLSKRAGDVKRSTVESVIRDALRVHFGRAMVQGVRVSDAKPAEPATTA